MMSTVRRGNTHSMQKAQLEQARRLEENREDTLKTLARDTMETSNILSEERVEEKRFLRRLQQEQKEQEMYDAIIKAEQDRIIKEQQQEQEELLSAELGRLKMEKSRDEKMRQQIRENCQELRELEAQLKAAYMNKERSAQLAEKEALKIDEMKRDAEIHRLMKEEHERASSATNQKEVERYQENVHYQQELERQLEEQERKKQQAYEEFLKEKLMIDEIVRKIYEEDQRERERNLEKKHATRRYIDDFKSKREEWKKLEESRLAEENERIKAYAAMQGVRERERQVAKQAADETRAQAQDKLSSEIAQKKRMTDEMEEVRLELYQQEQEERERDRERAAMEKAIRQRLELQKEQHEQHMYKEMRRHAEKEEEEDFRRQMLAKFAEDDRIEQMNAAKRRMKQLEHKRAVESLLEERRHQFAADRETELSERRMEEEMEAYRKQIIEEERMRLLQQHATKLLGYLPKGVIRDDQDLEMLGGEFKETYRKRQVDPYDEEAWEGRY